MLKIWVEDPKDKKPSVSLTLLCVGVIFYIAFAILDRMGKVHGVGAFAELFYTTVGLYFGRKLDFNRLIEKKNGSTKNEKK